MARCCDVERPQPSISASVQPMFEVRVYGEPELNNTYRVSPEGSIDFPPIGRVPVKGMTAAQVAEAIRERRRASPSSRGSTCSSKRSTARR